MAKEARVFMRTSPIAPMLLDPRAVQALQPGELDFTSKETRVAVLDMVLLHTCPSPNSCSIASEEGLAFRYCELGEESSGKQRSC